MKRLPMVVSFVLFIGLCATIAYWVLEFTKPPLRPIAPPPRAAQTDIGLAAASGLFGGRTAVAVASNYQLKGVVMSGTPSESVAILAADNKPAQAVRVGAEILPGTIVKEVQARHVLLSEGGVIKRVDLPNEAQAAAAASANTPPSANLQIQRQMQMQQQQQQQMQQMQRMEMERQQMEMQAQQSAPRAPQPSPAQQIPPGQPMAPSPSQGVTQQMPEEAPEGPIPGQEDSGMPQGFPPPGDMPPEEGIDPGMPPGTQ